MDKEQIRRFCVALTLFSILTRAGAYLSPRLFPPEADEPALWRVDIEPPAAAAEVLSLQHAASPAPSASFLPAAEASAPGGDAPEDEASEKTAADEPSSSEEDRAAAEEAPSEPLVFSSAEADAISISGTCSYQPDSQALLLRPSALDFSGDGPKVLIVHTHASEAYSPEDGLSYVASDPLRTEDPSRSVIRLGSEIADILNEGGLETIHDTTLNDYPAYDGAYARMQTIIESYLTTYPSIQMVIDVHRDAFEDEAGNPASITANIGGEECAKLMLVVGTDEGGLTHPNWQENFANALKLQALLNRAAPGLCRPLDLRTERFNQHETPGSILCEFGAAGNTLTQALRTSRIFADALLRLARGTGAKKT